MDFWAWLGNTSWAVALQNSRWLYSLCEVSHYFGLFVLVGTTVIVDLRILGLASSRQSASQLTKQFFPWTYTALGVVVLSGFLMFTTDAIHYVPNGVFHLKLLALLLAVICSLLVQKKISRWGEAEAMPLGAKLIAVVSLVLWIGTIIVAVEIPALTGVG